MRESNFTTDVMRSLRRIGAWAYKIPDAPSSKITGLRFTAAKPCDIVACVDGKFVAIETKFKKKFSAFSVRDMRESQLVNLTNILRDNGNAYVFLGIKEPCHSTKLFIFEWAHIGELFAVGLSMSAKDLKGLPYLEMESGVFDLSEWKDELECLP
jgi:penicillin-binding protein-related factor A (putative recombinase)